MAEACERPNRVWQEGEYPICPHSGLGSRRIEVPGTVWSPCLSKGCGSTNPPFPRFRRRCCC